MLTLRAILRLFGLGVLVYVAIIAAVIILRIAPTARALGIRSERVRAEFAAINERSNALHATIDEIHAWRRTVQRPEQLLPAMRGIRARVDSLTTAAGVATQLSAIPTAMRVEFSRSIVEQSLVGTTLLEALANLELGRTREAERQLGRADSITYLIDRHMATAQRVGLEDLIGRDQALAAAANSSLRALGAWAALGIVLTPFVVIFLRRRFYDPLDELATGIAQVAQGDLGWTIPVRRRDELGQLSEHFNEAAAILCQRAEETRQRAQTALRQSEERYEAMVESAPIGIAVVDSAGRYIHTNPTLQRFLGYSEAELRGKSFREVTLPEDLEPSDGRFAQLIAGAYDRYTMEKRYVRKDGELVWGRISVAGVRDASGTLVHTVSMIEDVTDEKSLQAAAREAEQRFHAVVSGAPIMLFGIDTDGVITVSEGKGLAALGQRPGDVVGQSIFDQLRDAPEFAKPFRLALEGQMFHGVGTYQGTTIEAWVTPMRDPDGRVTGAIGVATDVTDRVRAEQARHKSEEKFETAFRMSPNPSVITRLEDGLVVDVNAAYCLTSGFTRDEVIGKTAREVLWPDPDRREDFVRQLREHGHVRDLELKMKTKSGAQLDVLVSVENIELDGVPHTLGAAVDITNRKRAAEALRQSEEKFAKAFRVSPNALGITELESGILVDANDAFFATFGYRREEALGRPSRDLIWPDPDKRDYYAAKLQAQGRLQSEEVTLRTNTGGTVEALISAELIELGGRTYILTNVLDITARKRALGALRESEERFRRLVQDMSIGVALLDPQGRVIHANPAAREILALTDAEISDPTFWQREMVGLREDGTPYSDADRPVLKAIRTGETLHNVLIGIPARGRPENRWALVNVDPQRDADGTIRSVIVWFSDITDQRKADQQLRLLAQAVKSTSEMIAITDLEGRFTFVNEAFLEKTGYAEPEVLGQPTTIINSPRNPAGLRETIRAGTERGGWSGEFYSRRKDGTDFITALTTAPVRNSDGKIIALMGVSSDITARKQAEYQLRLLAQAVKSTTESISITDLDGRFTFVNRGFAETCGYTEQELIGQRVSLIDSPRNPSALQDEVRTATMRRGTWTGELYNRRKNGTDFLISLTTAQVKDEHGRVIALMGVSSDITERKQLQESLRRSETMSALGAVVAGVAHEVRNPLFGISGTVDAFEARFGADPTQARYTKTLRQEVGRLTKLMQDLLEYGKPPRLEVTVGAIAPVVRRAVGASAALAESTGVWIRDAIPDDLPSIPMDQSRIQQVFQNLIDNAIQHTPRGKSVAISARHYGHGANAMVEITVADQGSGFPAEDLPRLFEPFFTRRRGGTGLGLSIVHRILEQHEGDIVARNGASGGAVLTVRLPLARDAVTTEATRV